MSRGIRRVAFPAIATVLAVAVGYALLETTVQIAARLGAISEFEDLRYVEETLRESLERDGTHPVAPIDPELGWVQDVMVFGPEPEPEASAKTGPTVLFLGDSVTFGELATRGVDDYVTRVAEALAPSGVRVANAAASGYGVDQMMLRMPREVARFSPDVIVVAYIAHDLRRIGRTRFIRIPKPTVEPIGPGLRTHPPEDMLGFYAREAAAADGFRYGAWLLADRFAQRRYGLPAAYRAWYEAVLERITARMAREARAAGASLVFVEIPSFADPPSVHLLAPIMRRVLDAGVRSGAYEAVALEPCLRERAEPDPWPTREFTELHPSAPGHADLAVCLLREVLDAERFSPP